MITYWLLGSFASIDPKDVKLAAIPIVLGCIPLLLLRWRLNVLCLGEEEARTLGLNTRRLRFIVIICATLITAASVSICGMVGWIGLVVPHLARMVVGPNYKVLLPAAAIMGGCFLLLVDDVARTAGCIGNSGRHSHGAHRRTILSLPADAGAQEPGMNLTLEHVTGGYGSRTVLHDVSFSLQPGEVVCLLGANGCGKTTLFKMILRLLRPTRGCVRLGGENIAGWDQQRLARSFGYVPQMHTPPFAFLVRDIVLMARAAHLPPFASPGKVDERIADEALDSLGILRLASERYTEISGGERQLVLIARALAQTGAVADSRRTRGEPRPGQPDQGPARRRRTGEDRAWRADDHARCRTTRFCAPRAWR